MKAMTVPWAGLAVTAAALGVHLTSLAQSNPPRDVEWVVHSRQICSQPDASASAPTRDAPACTVAEYRSVPLAPQRHLLFGRNVLTHPPLLLEVEPQAPHRVSLRPYTAPLIDLPFDVRAAIADNVRDMRVGRPTALSEPWQAPKSPLQPLGIPTPQGLATARTMMAKALSPPGGSIRTEADARLSALFPTDPATREPVFSAARLGANGVVVKDVRSPATRLAHFDTQTHTLTQDVVVQGLAAPPACSDRDPRDETLFNDDQAQLYLLRGRSGDVFAIDPQFRANWLARPPKVAGPVGQTCDAPRSVGPVVHAVRLASGNLLLATGVGLLLQQGEVLHAVASLRFPYQILEVRGPDALVLAAEGIARVRLPQ